MQIDPVAAKQKSTQQAKLATRRLRSQLQKRPGSRASMGNSLILAKASLSLIRGNADVNLGWERSSRTASLLCFDELQVDLSSRVICHVYTRAMVSCLRCSPVKQQQVQQCFPCRLEILFLLLRSRACWKLFLIRGQFLCAQAILPSQTSIVTGSMR